ncbi:MAG: hypothetical protein IJY23_05895 [Clostridia bacterium]|nr:hypothetical protein [Clostridia bacterium]
MKKIIAVLLLICSFLTVVSCSKKDENLERFDEMFASSAPTKAVTVVNQTFNDYVELNSVFTLTTGTVNGKTATTMVSEVQTLNKVDSGKTNYINTQVTNNWYYEGKGTSTDKGVSWNADGKDFAPKPGTLSMNLKVDYMDSVNYFSDATSETIVLEVSAENASKVLENFIDSETDFEYDVTITVVAAGERISSVVIEYVIDEHLIGEDENAIEVEDTEFVITVNYSYDIQAVTFE